MGPQPQAEADSILARIYILRGDLYATSPGGKPVAQPQYQAAIDLLSRLKADNQISLGGMKDLREAQQKFQVLAG